MTHTTVGEALDRAIVRIDAHESCDVTVFDGVARFAPVLVGPPGRLHGGLHLAARTLRVLAALDRSGETTGKPVRIDVALGKAIPLEADVPFDGALVQHGDGFSLETRFLESDRLTATARALPRYEAPAWLDRAALDRGLREEARRIRILGIPFSITKTLCFVDVLPGAHDEKNDLAKYVRDDGRLDATWVCAALDTCAAVSVGVLWDNHLFTTKASLELSTMPIALDRALVLVAHFDEQTSVEDSTMGVVRVGDRELTTTRIPVTLLYRDDLTPIAHGDFELHPVDHARFASGALRPREGAVEEEGSKA